uniref:Uncharacterized protein n=1 Tax=Rhizophora mucronata TaxID=61149 RepID=A0A2P2P6T7_RHIMU
MIVTSENLECKTYRIQMKSFQSNTQYGH